MSKSNMELEVSFMAGTSLKDAVCEAKVKVAILNVAFVNFNFNGVSISISADADVEYVIDTYDHGGVLVQYGICS